MALATIFPVFRAKGPVFNQQKVPLSVPDDIDSEDVRREVFGSAFSIQASLNENYRMSAEVSDNPVESGIDVSDNYNVKPLVITLTMRQSDTPINVDSILRGAAVSGGTLFGKKVGGFYGQQAAGVAAGAFSGLLTPDASTPAPDGVRRGLARTAYEQFRSMLEAGAVITVQTGLDLFPNMMLIDVDVNRNNRTGRSIEFTVVLRQVRFVSSLMIDVPVIPQRSVSDQASARVDQGQQNSKATTGQRKSLLKNASALIFGGNT